MNYAEFVPSAYNICAKQPFFVCTEVNRKQCIGTILRCATAFGVAEAAVIGTKHYSTHGSHGAHRRTLVRQFYRFSQCVRHFQSLYFDLQVVGVVFRRSCKSVSTLDSTRLLPFENVAFTSPTLMVLADAETGLNAEQLSVCSIVVFVPVPDPNLENRLHRDIKLSLVLQKVAVDLGCLPVESTSSKFLVVKDPVAVHVVRSRGEQKAIDQAASQAENITEEEDNEGSLFNLFNEFIVAHT